MYTSVDIAYDLSFVASCIVHSEIISKRRSSMILILLNAIPHWLLSKQPSVVSIKH